MTDDELRDLLALAAVGALGDEEQAELDRAIADRADLQAELAGLRDAAATMATAVAEPPPPALRAQVLDLIASTPQLPRESAATEPASAPAAEAARPLAPVVPISSARRRRWWAVGAAAAAVVALLVGVLVVSPWSDDGGGDQVAAVIDAADAQTIPMPGDVPGFSVVHSASQGAGVLQGTDLPVPAGDRVYELWAIRDDTPERVDTFRPGADGELVVYLADFDPASAQQWAITEEPAGGSDAPTSAIIAATAA